MLYSFIKKWKHSGYDYHVCSCNKKASDPCAKKRRSLYMMYNSTANRKSKILRTYYIGTSARVILLYTTRLAAAADCCCSHAASVIDHPHPTTHQRGGASAIISSSFLYQQVHRRECVEIWQQQVYYLSA